MTAYGERWRARRIALVGYSFGADVLPFGYNRLPADLRAQIAQISLLGFSAKASFEIHVAGWLGAGPGADAPPTLPEIKRIEAPSVQCFYGADEADSACPVLAAAGAEVIETGGGHHFGGDYGFLADRIARGLARRLKIADASAGKAGGRTPAGTAGGY